MTKQQKMKQQNVGQDCNILRHVLGSEIQKAKISTLKESGWIFTGDYYPIKPERVMQKWSGILHCAKAQRS